jgi:nucleoside-diphosphate-sugar epimerase
MRVFITGWTGTIGEAVIKELRRAGHAVTGLSRQRGLGRKS